jgi:hypothetical protein
MSRLSPAQARTLVAVGEGHVHIRYGHASRDYRRHADGGYSWNIMAAICTLQTEVLERDKLIVAGPLVTEFGLKSRKWITTHDGNEKIREILGK